VRNAGGERSRPCRMKGAGTSTAWREPMPSSGAVLLAGGTAIAMGRTTSFRSRDTMDPRPFPPPPPLPGPEQPSLAHPRWLELLILVPAILLGSALVFWALTAEERALRKMEPSARAALFSQTWRGFQSLCGEAPEPGLHPRCQEQARFLQRFPECEDACRRRLAVFLQATR
jgi:hypothetical protein